MVSMIFIYLIGSTRKKLMNVFTAFECWFISNVFVMQVGELEVWSQFGAAEILENTLQLTVVSVPVGKTV